MREKKLGGEKTKSIYILDSIDDLNKKIVPVKTNSPVKNDLTTKTSRMEWKWLDFDPQLLNISQNKCF